MIKDRFIRSTHETFPFLMIFNTIILMILIQWNTASASTTFNIERIQPNELNLQKKFIIIDARPKMKWRSGHIPGAISINWEGYTDIDEKKIPHRLIPVKKLAEKIGKKGINESSNLAVYGDADSSWGSEGWACWLFTYLGHKGKIVLIDGGISKWKALGYTLSKKKTTPSPSRYNPVVNNHVIISTSQLKSSLKTIQIVDTRSTFEWFRGAIPGAVHIHWKKFYSGKHNTLISAHELKTLLEEKKINPEKPVVYYCTGGVRSAYSWLAHSMAGFSTPINYEGGMAAWGNK